jgi:hypothetical protein
MISRAIETLECQVREYIQDNSNEMPYWLYSNLVDFVDKATNELKAELKAKDEENTKLKERIAELEVKSPTNGCKNCKFCEPLNEEELPGYTWCSKLAKAFEPNGFCSEFEKD